MDWVNTQLGRDFCFGVVFPQVLPHHKRRSEGAQAATLQWGNERSQAWLARMKALKSWKQVNATLDGLAASLKGKPFVTV